MSQPSTSQIEDDVDPFASLLAQHKSEPSAIENPLRKKSNVSKLETILKLDDKDSDDDTPISMTVRQPSFTSLHGPIITKGGELVGELPNLDEDPDPLIVFGQPETDGDDNTPITLSVRQPSFVSLTGQIIPKGSDSLADFKPVIETVYNSGIESIAEEPQLEEEEEPQVAFVRELQIKNQNRWRAMGYEPPENLLNLVRAASQTHLTGIQSNAVVKCPASSSMKQLPGYVPLSNPPKPVLETVAEDSPPHYSPQPFNRRKRSGSFGMKLDQMNSSSELMSEIIREHVPTHQTLEIPIGESLPGRLQDIIEEDPDSEFYTCLLNAKCEKQNYAHEFRQRVQHYIDVCNSNGLIDEVDYLNYIIQSTHEDDSQANYSSKVDELEAQMEDALNTNTEQYYEAVQQLDEKYNDPKIALPYQKPTSQILSLRAKAKAMVRSNRIDEARELMAEIKVLEEEVAQKAARILKKKYHDEDKKLKITFAEKRAHIIKKYQALIEKEKLFGGEELSMSTIDINSQAASTTGKLSIQAPKLLDRSNDLEILDDLSEKILNGATTRSITMNTVRSPRRKAVQHE